METENKHDASVGELLGELTRNLSILIRGEVALVRLELRRAVAQFGTAMVLFVVAGLLAFCGYIFFLLMLHSAFVQLLGPWIGELVVMVILLATAGVLVWMGAKKLDQWKVSGLHPGSIAKASRPGASAAKKPSSEETDEVN